MLEQFPSIQKLDIQPPPGYFDASIIACEKTVQLWNQPSWQDKALAIISAVGTLIIMVLNTFTGVIKLVGISKFNNILEAETRTIYHESSANYKIKRLKYDALKEIVDGERRKILDMIFQPISNLSLSGLIQLSSSKQVIYSEMKTLLDLPENFWKEFLQEIFDQNGAAIQTGIDEVVTILDNPQKIKEMAIYYQKEIISRGHKYNDLGNKKTQYDQRIENLKKDLSKDKDSLQIKYQIENLEKKSLELAKKMSSLISDKELAALKSWSWQRDSYFINLVKNKLIAKKTFLESIKKQENLYIPCEENKRSWVKTALVVSTVAAGCASAWYVYNYGIPSYSEIRDVAVLAADKAQKSTKYLWEKIPTIGQVKENAAYAYENASLENIGKVWKSMTYENLQGFASKSKNLTFSFFSSFFSDENPSPSNPAKSTVSVDENPSPSNPAKSTVSVDENPSPSNPIIEGISPAILNPFKRPISAAAGN
jgi:hypothetical protein